MICLQEKTEEGFKSNRGEKSQRSEVKKSSEYGVAICELKDPEYEKYIKKKSFNHLVCLQCYNENLLIDNNIPNFSKKEINQTQYCMICNSLHTLKTVMPSTKGSKLKINEDCKIL